MGVYWDLISRAGALVGALRRAGTKGDFQGVCCDIKVGEGTGLIESYKESPGNEKNITEWLGSFA